MPGRTLLSQGLGHLFFHGIHSEKLTNWYSKHNLNNVNLLANTSADIISLNEVLGSLKKEEIIEEFKKHGYNYSCWGSAKHYPKPMDIGTLIVSKTKFQKLNFTLPMENKMGTGGGACAIFIKEKNLTVLAVHLGLKEKLFNDQIEAIYEFINEQESKNRRIILMGDFNKKSLRLNLLPSTKEKTCPNIKMLPKKSVDNIYFSKEIKLKHSETFNAYSDHKGVLADLKI